MKMKDEKQKHDHKLTNLIKVCIFGILMIAPLLASVSQMLYVTLNKNAKDSYYGETINEVTNNKVNNVNDIQVNTTYIFTSSSLSETLGSYEGSYNGVFYLNNIEIISNETGINLSTLNNLSFYTSQTGTQLSTRFWNDTTLLGYSYGQFTIKANIYAFNINDAQKTMYNRIFNASNCMQKITYNKYSYLDNAFYYGVDQMTKSDLFNWTKNTAIYNGVKTMTDNLQIQTPAIAILIVYWFILTIIYIIIDIVLKCFTTITHMIFRAD